MKISILPGHNTVTVNGEMATFPFELPTIHAVQADLKNDRAEVEYRSIDPDGPGPLPAVKPPNEMIDADEFNRRFRDVMEGWAKAISAKPEPKQSDPKSPSKPAEKSKLVVEVERLTAIVDRHEAFMRGLVADAQSKLMKP